MNTDEIIETLKRERAECEARAKTNSDRAAQLTAAIQALEGKEAKPPNALVPVIARIEAAARQLAARNGKDAVFDFAILVETANTMYPGDLNGIRRGVYSAVASLKKKQVLKLVPGGMSLGN